MHGKMNVKLYTNVFAVC